VKTLHVMPAIITLKIFLFFIISVFPITALSDDLRLADKFFYNSQYKKAIKYYLKSLETPQKNITEIKYRIGLSYFLIHDSEKALKYWEEAKKENPAIFKSKTYRIPSGGMIPTLRIGDHIIADNEYYKNKSITRGDVVVFLYPEDETKIFIKRIIGLPGDLIEIKEKKVYINGKLFPEPYIIHGDPTIYSSKTQPRDNFEKIVVPIGSYFIMGDNRDFSLDSRYFGSIEKRVILGKA